MDSVKQPVLIEAPDELSIEQQIAQNASAFLRQGVADLNAIAAATAWLLGLSPDVVRRELGLPVK